MVSGNHEDRTERVAGILPDAYMSTRLGIPFAGYSALLVLNAREGYPPRTWTCFVHHGAGGGYSFGGKKTASIKVREIVPTADAIFTGHSHITDRTPLAWYEAGKKSVVKKVGYNYVVGSALTWDGSYAENKAKRPSCVESISVEFTPGGCKDKDPATGCYDRRKQTYRVHGLEIMSDAKS
jgi:hypothetical protein